MSNGNSITLVGNITRDPELRFTPSGQAKASLGIAVNRRWQNRQTQEWEEATSFFNVVCWREMAENTSESLQKGARVIVTGRLEQRSYETPEGEKRSVVEVVNQGMWALDTQQLDTTNVTSVGIGDGSAAYLRFGVRPNTVGGGRITARGAVVPPGFALTVLRTK